MGGFDRISGIAAALLNARDKSCLAGRDFRYLQALFSNCDWGAGGGSSQVIMHYTLEPWLGVLDVLKCQTIRYIRRPSPMGVQ